MEVSPHGGGRVDERPAAAGPTRSFFDLPDELLGDSHADRRVLEPAPEALLGHAAHVDLAQGFATGRPVAVAELGLGPPAARVSSQATPPQQDAAVAHVLEDPNRQPR